MSPQAAATRWYLQVGQKTYPSKHEVVDSRPSYIYTYRYIVINDAIGGS